MIPLNQQFSTPPGRQNEDGGYEFFCKLFEDMISTGLCVLRRRLLNGQDGFSCEGCSKDTIINSLQRRRLIVRRQN